MEKKHTKDELQFTDLSAHQVIHSVPSRNYV